MSEEIDKNVSSTFLSLLKYILMKFICAPKAEK